MADQSQWGHPQQPQLPARPLPSAPNGASELPPTFIRPPMDPTFAQMEANEQQISPQAAPNVAGQPPRSLPGLPARPLPKGPAPQNPGGAYLPPAATPPPGAAPGAPKTGGPAPPRALDPKRASVKLPMLPGRSQVLPIAVAQQQQQAHATSGAEPSSQPALAQPAATYTPVAAPAPTVTAGEQIAQPGLARTVSAPGLKRPLPGFGPNVVMNTAGSDRPLPPREPGAPLSQPKQSSPPARPLPVAGTPTSQQSPGSSPVLPRPQPPTGGIPNEQAPQVVAGAESSTQAMPSPVKRPLPGVGKVGLPGMSQQSSPPQGPRPGIAKFGLPGMAQPTPNVAVENNTASESTQENTIAVQPAISPNATYSSEQQANQDAGASPLGPSPQFTQFSIQQGSVPLMSPMSQPPSQSPLGPPPSGLGAPPTQPSSQPPLGPPPSAQAPPMYPPQQQMFQPAEQTANASAGLVRSPSAQDNKPALNKRMSMAIDFKPVTRSFPVPPPRKQSSELPPPRVRTPSDAASIIPRVPPSLSDRDPSLAEFIRTPPVPVENIPESRLLKPIIPSTLMVRLATESSDTVSADELSVSESSEGGHEYQGSPASGFADPLNYYSDADGMASSSPAAQSVLSGSAPYDSVLDPTSDYDHQVHSDEWTSQPGYQNYQGGEMGSYDMQSQQHQQQYSGYPAADSYQTEQQQQYNYNQYDAGQYNNEQYQYAVESAVSAEGPELPPADLQPLPEAWHPRVPAPTLPPGYTLVVDSNVTSPASSVPQTPQTPATPSTPATPATPSTPATEEEKKKKFGFKFPFGGSQKDKSASAAAAPPSPSTEQATDAKKKGLKGSLKALGSDMKGIFGKRSKSDAAETIPEADASPAAASEEELSPIAHLYDGYRQLMDIFSRDDLTFAFWMAQLVKRADVDKQARAWSKVFRHKNKIMELLGVLIQYEIDSTQAEGTLFRNNNFIVGLLSQFTQDISKPYLKQVLLPLLEYIQTCGLDFEIQPDKITDPSADIDKNTINFYELATRFLTSIMNSVDIIPKEIRIISATLQHYVRAKFPAAVHTVVGGFFFLRLICPAIVSPEGFGVWPESMPLSIEQRRPLVLVSKTLQSLANEMYFSEDYMMVLNSFVTENVPVLQNFFSHMAYYDEGLASAPATFQSDFPDDESLIRFHQMLHKLWEPELKPLLLQKGVTAEALGYDGVAEIDAVLAQLGEPVDPKVLRDARKARESQPATPIAAPKGKEKDKKDKKDKK